MLAGSGLLALALWFTSRFFNDNYIGVVSILFTLAYAAQVLKEEHS
jgi:hypothetical protein